MYWSLCYFKPFWISIERLENVQAALFHKTKVDDDLYRDAFMFEWTISTHLTHLVTNPLFLTI